MAIKSGAWHYRFRIDWADQPGPAVIDDDGWRMKILDGGALLFEGNPPPPPHSEPPGTLLLGPHRWNSMRIASVSKMPKPVIQCESAHVWLKGEKTYRSADYEMNLLAGGMLMLREKPPVDWRELNPSFLEYVLVAPHGWNLVRTASLDKLTIDGSHWCNLPHMALWLPDDAPRIFAEDKCRLRVINGGMLLFQAESGDKDFVIVHPHGWSAVKGMFDFTK